MLRPLSEDDVDTAVALLDEGFPGRGAEWWRAALARMIAHGTNRAADYPLGFLLMEGAEAVGILLTLAVLRDGRLQVNQSSWYVRPEQRHRALTMLRGALRYREALFTDLSPSPSVAKMLPMLGFRQMTIGYNIDMLPLLALRPGGTAKPWRGTTGTIAAHCAMGAIALELDGQPVVLRPTRVKGLKAASLVYAERPPTGLGALARFLLARDYWFLLTDCRIEADKGRLFRPYNIWFARGEGLEVRIDKLDSELFLLGL